MKYAIVTFGCRVNQADSLRIEEELLAQGGVPTTADLAEWVVVNTCSVTATADQGARQTIRRIARSNPSAKIVVTGCYATRCAEDVAALPGVLQIVRNDRKEHLVEDAGVTTAERFGEGSGACGAAVAPGVAGRTAYTLRVQTGCEERCTYCIIPTTRGPARSRAIDDVLAEIDRICGAGYREIALTGVHLGSYGRDLPQPRTLLHLLVAIERRAPPDVLLRLSSLEPMDCTRDVVDLMAGSARFAPHLHLPLQHASDRILRAMGRPYTLEYYRALVDLIRGRLPHASIGSDVIVGFPGERDEDIDTLLIYLAHAPLTHLHVFPYSDRPGTRAESLPERVPGNAIRQRAGLVREVGRSLTSAFHRAQVGSVRRGLTIDDGSMVVTDNYLKVSIPPGHVRNEWVNVRVRLVGGTLFGELVPRCSS